MVALNDPATPSPGGAPAPSSSSAFTRSPIRRAPRKQPPFIKSPNNNSASGSNDDERMTMERAYKPLTSAPLNGGRNNNGSISISVNHNSVRSGPQTCSAVNRRRAFHHDPNHMPQLPFDKHAAECSKGKGLPRRNNNHFDNHIRRLERRGTDGMDHATGATNNNSSSSRRLDRRSMHDEMVGMASRTSQLQPPPPPRQLQHHLQPPPIIMKPQSKNNKPNNHKPSSSNSNSSNSRTDRIILVDEKDKKSFWSSARGNGMDRDLNDLDNTNPSHHQRNQSNSSSIPPIPERRPRVVATSSQQNIANASSDNNTNNNMNMNNVSFGSNISSQPSNESKTSKVSPVCVSQVHIHNLKFSSPAAAAAAAAAVNKSSVSPRHMKPIRQLPLPTHYHNGQGGATTTTTTTIKAQPHHPRPPPPPRQPGKITPPPPRSKIHDTRVSDVVNKLVNCKIDLPLSSPGNYSQQQPQPGGRFSPNGSHATSQVHDGKLKASSGHVRQVSAPPDNGVYTPNKTASHHVRQVSAPPSSSASSIPLPKTKLRRASSDSSETKISKNQMYPPPPKNHSVNINKSPGAVGRVISPVVSTRNNNMNNTVQVGSTRGSTSRPPFQDATASKLATNNNTSNTDFNKSMSGTLLNEKMASMTIERMMNLPPQVLRRQLNHAQELSALTTTSTTKLQHHGQSRHSVKSAAQHQQQQQSGQQQGGKQQQDQPQDHSQDQSQRGVRQDYTLGETARSSSHMVIESNPKAATHAVNSLNNHDFAFIKRSDGSYSYAILAYRSNTEEEKRELQEQLLQGEAIGQVSLDNDNEEEEEEEECMTFVLSNAGCTKLIKKSQWCEYVRLISNKASSDEFMMSSNSEDTRQEVNHTTSSTTPNEATSPPNSNDTKEEEEVKSDHEVEEYLKKLRQEFYATRGPPTVGDGWIPPTTISFDIEDDDISCVSEAIVYSSTQQQPHPPPHNNESSEGIIENGVGTTRYKPSQPRILE